MRERAKGAVTKYSCRRTHGISKDDWTVNKDSIHGTTGYDFQLTTLLVFEEYGLGLPVLFTARLMQQPLKLPFRA